MTIVRLEDGRSAESVIPEPWIDSLVYYASRAPAGAIVEVGVYRGGSALALSKLGREMWLYDTFAGIPEQGELDRANWPGKFSDTGADLVRELLPDAHVIEGLFPDSLVPMPPVGFVHADADQYGVTKAILRVMPPLMVRGGFILLDDFGVPGCEGATAAVRESGLRILQIAESGKALIIV